MNYHLNQHWCPPGSCSLPTPDLSVCKWMTCFLKLLKFADYIIATALIPDSDMPAYRPVMAAWAGIGGQCPLKDNFARPGNKM